MSPTPEPPEPSDPSINPYNAPESTERADLPPRRRRPHVGIVILAVVLGLILAFVGFFVTCLGLAIMFQGAPSDAALFMVLFASVVTAIAAFAFTVWGIIKLNEPYRSP